MAGSAWACDSSRAVRKERSPCLIRTTRRSPRHPGSAGKLAFRTGGGWLAACWLASWRRRCRPQRRCRPRASPPASRSRRSSRHRSDPVVGAWVARKLQPGSVAAMSPPAPDATVQQEATQDEMAGYLDAQPEARRRPYRRPPRGPAGAARRARGRCGAADGGALGARPGRDRPAAAGVRRARPWRRAAVRLGHLGRGRADRDRAGDDAGPAGQGRPDPPAARARPRLVLCRRQHRRFPAVHLAAQPASGRARLSERDAGAAVGRRHRPVPVRTRGAAVPDAADERPDGRTLAVLEFRLRRLVRLRLRHHPAIARPGHEFRQLAAAGLPARIGAAGDRLAPGLAPGLDDGPAASSARCWPC